MLKTIAAIITITLLAWIQKPPAKFAAPSTDTTLTIDGPYVLYRGDSILVQYIDSADGRVSLRTTQLTQSEKGNIQLVINTDEPGKTFNVKLHSKISPEKSTYNKPKKMMVVSDMEGEFTAMRKLLQGNGVIDENLKWIFGDGHLVLTGDFVDRGTMVTELLWLIYSLEDQAEASGGKVHYILGNHEIMNMTGDHNYVHPRYIAHAGTMQVPYLDLFGKHAELGRWLSSKNITEKIGNMLFTHGGFSPYMNQAELPVNAINDTARIYYTDTSYSFPSVYSELLFSDDGPFWYRGYYMGKQRATASQVDSTLNLYNCRTIVTGHSIIAREIVSLFDGKVIDLDVQHHKGFSEALFVDGNKMYRVNANGEQKTINAFPK